MPGAALRHQLAQSYPKQKEPQRRSAGSRDLPWLPSSLHQGSNVLQSVRIGTHAFSLQVRIQEPKTKLGFSQRLHGDQRWMSRGCDLKHHEKLGHKPGPSGMPGLDKIPRQAKAAVPQPQFFRVLGRRDCCFPRANAQRGRSWVDHCIIGATLNVFPGRYISPVLCCRGPFFHLFKFCGNQGFAWQFLVLQDAPPMLFSTAARMAEYSEV